MNKTKPNLNISQILRNIKMSLLAIEPWIWKSSQPTLSYESLVTTVLDRFLLIYRTRGRKAALQEMKLSRLAFTRWVAGKAMKGYVGAPITKVGLPKVLPLEVRRFVRRDDTHLIKAILTVLTISRYFKGGDPVDLTAITSEWGGCDNVTDKEMRCGLQSLRLKSSNPRPEVSDKKIFAWVSTAGPNGPSLASSLSDLPKFNQAFRPEVEVLLPSLLPHTDRLLIWERNMNLTKELSIGSYPTEKLRKISVKEDREGKSRIFAIFDYWSQTTLSPLHDWLFSILRKIPQDCTFNQQEGITKLLSRPSKKWFYSYDLKSATDRFPVVFQERVLGLLVDKEYAKAWRSIMTREPFHWGSADLLKWGTGQPLGAKSSWAMFTLCHHLVVRIAAQRANVGADYVILGDDIVIRGYALAHHYLAIMESLGVSISETKSHVSPDTFEFAKIWIRKGVNISGFPIVGFVETLEKPIELATLLVYELPHKGYFTDWDPRTLSEHLSPLCALWADKPRLAVWKVNRVVWFIAFIQWLKNGSCDWAKFLALMADVCLPKESCYDLLWFIVKSKWSHIVQKSLEDLKAFAWNLARKLPDSVAFAEARLERDVLMVDTSSLPGSVNMDGVIPIDINSIEFDDDDDDCMIMGSATPNSLQLADHLLHIPLFSALCFESEKQYDSFLNGSPQERQNLSLQELENLKIPPKPQMKGFVPERAKTNVRALDLLTREINSKIRILSFHPRRL